MWKTNYNKENLKIVKIKIIILTKEKGNFKVLAGFIIKQKGLMVSRSCWVQMTHTNSTRKRHVCSHSPMQWAPFLTIAKPHGVHISQ